MFKDYQFFSINLQDAARQILEAQTGEIRGADPDIQRGQHPIYPEGQTDSSYEDNSPVLLSKPFVNDPKRIKMPKIDPESVNKNKMTRQPYPPGTTPEEIEDMRKQEDEYLKGEDAPSEDAPSKEDIDAYKKAMMDSIVKEISRSRPKKETKNTGSKEFNKNENTPTEPASDNTDQQEYPKYRKQS